MKKEVFPVQEDMQQISLEKLKVKGETLRPKGTKCEAQQMPLIIYEKTLDLTAGLYSLNP